MNRVIWQIALCASLLSACDNGAATSTIAATSRSEPADPPSSEVVATIAPAPFRSERTKAAEGKLTADNRWTLANVVNALRGNVVGKARMDGAPVTALRAASPCVTVFTAGKADVAIAWPEVGNLAGRQDGDEEVLALPSGGSTHRLSTAVGRDADLVSSGTGMLAMTCGAIK